MEDQSNKNQENRGGADQGRSAYSTGTKQSGSNYGELSETSGSTQKGGGAGGYDVSREQEQVNKEREDMNSERNLDDVDVERPQTSPDEGQQPHPGETPRTE